MICETGLEVPGTVVLANRTKYSTKPCDTSRFPRLLPRFPVSEMPALRRRVGRDRSRN